MRKFFASTLHKQGVPYLDTSWFLGHRVKGVDEAYFKPDPEKMKEQYTTILPEVTILDGFTPKVTETRLNSIQKELDDAKLQNKMVLEFEKIKKELEEDGHR